MEADPLFLDPWHPLDIYSRRDLNAGARHLTRTARPVKYYFIDFELSRQYDPNGPPPVETEFISGDDSIPEYFVHRVPYDPFPVDVYCAGNIMLEYLDVREVLEVVFITTPTHIAMIEIPGIRVCSNTGSQYDRIRSPQTSHLRRCLYHIRIHSKEFGHSISTQTASTEGRVSPGNIFQRYQPFISDTQVYSLQTAGTSDSFVMTCTSFHITSPLLTYSCLRRALSYTLSPQVIEPASRIGCGSLFWFCFCLCF